LITETKSAMLVLSSVYLASRTLITVLCAKLVSEEPWKLLCVVVKMDTTIMESSTVKFVNLLVLLVITEILV